MPSWIMHDYQVGVVGVLMVGEPGAQFDQALSRGVRVGNDVLEMRVQWYLR